MSSGLRMSMPFRPKPSVIPGFGLTLGLSMTWLCLIVLLPLAALFAHSANLGAGAFVDAVTNPRVVASLRLSFGTSVLAALVSVALGGFIAWVLVRHPFPGRRLVDAIVDIPFALPTAVAGIALTTLYAENGWLGGLLIHLGIKVAYTPLGIMVAQVFIGLPFVVRTVQPVIEDLDRETEEAAACLGAGRWQALRRVIFPAIAPALVTGFALAFARGVGEYGSIIFIAGNLPMISEIAPLLIVIKLEEFAYAEATAIAVVMLVVSFALLLVINILQRRMATTRVARR